jgi:hypothetical protein
MSASSTKAIRDLILWARKEKIVLSSVTLGNITVTVERDYGLQPPSGTPDAPERRPSIYEQYAGVLNKPAAVTPTANEPTEEDD